PLLRQAWVDLLNRYTWTWFTTLTFSDLPRSYTALNRAKKWLHSIENEERIHLAYYLALEYTKVLNLPHIHLLMGGLEGIRRDKWWSTWFTWYGRARILPYNKKLGAGYYLTKYVIKDIYQKGIFEIRGLQGARQLTLDLKN
ncbi:unnamed protein product, partial [marine sediment metagenome]